MAQTERFQNIEADLDLFHRIGGERDTDGIADAGPEQRSDPHGRFDGAAAQAPGLGDAEMQGIIAGIRQALMTERDIAASQGVYNFTEKDRYGLDDRSRILLTVKNGKYVLAK